MEGESGASAENQRRRPLAEGVGERSEQFEAERSEYAMEEEKILRLIKQKVRENFYQIPQYVLDEMINDGIWMDELRRAVESSQVLGTFEGRYTKDTMPGYEKSEGYFLWSFERSESRKTHINCQILDSGKLRIVDIDSP